jgi:hypothetical protein
VFTVYRVFNSNTEGFQEQTSEKKEISFTILPTTLCQQIEMFQQIETVHIQYSTISSVADPDPEGSASFWEAGSGTGSASK